MSIKTNETNKRELLAYLTKYQEPGRDPRYTLRFERNMAADSYEEPSADPVAGEIFDLSEQEKLDFEDRLGYQGVDGTERGDRGVYGLRAVVREGADQRPEVDWTNADPSVMGDSVDWMKVASKQTDYRNQAMNYELNGELPQMWTPQDARVEGQRPTQEQWSQMRAERWPSGPGRESVPPRAQVDARGHHPAQDKIAQRSAARPQYGQPNRAAQQAPGASQIQANSQAGLAAHVGGSRVSLPSVPAPGQPGSRFNPIVRERPAQQPQQLQERSIGDVPVYGPRQPQQPGPRFEERTGDVPIYDAPSAAPEAKKDNVAKRFARGFGQGMKAGMAGVKTPSPGTAAAAATRAGSVQQEAEEQAPDFISEVPEEVKNPSAGPTSPQVEGPRRLQMRGPGAQAQDQQPSPSGLKLAPGAQEPGAGGEREAGR